MERLLYRPEDLRRVDVREYVQNEQYRFFRSGQYNPFEAASLIVLEAVLVGAEDVRIRVVDGWICVLSDVDWLSGVESDAFSGLAPFKSGGPNSVTSDFFPVVFSRAVATATRDGARIVKGETLGPLSSLGDDWARVLAFEIAPARQGDREGSRGRESRKS